MAKLDSKRIFWILLNICLTVGAIVLVIAIIALWRYTKSVFPAKSVNVTAEGKAIAIPDIANLSFSVITEGADLKKVASENNQKINDVFNFIKSLGIKEKDIKTTGYNLSPRYEYDKKKQTSFISGYSLTQTVQLKLRDFNKISDILGALPEYGINQIGDLVFAVEEPEKYLAEAREEAFEKARAKAEAMARQNGVKIKRVISFSEFAGYQPPIPLGAAEFGKGGDQVVIKPTIEPGSQEVNVQVSVTYEIW